MKLVLKIAAGIVLAVVVLVVAISALVSKSVSDATKQQPWKVKVSAPAGMCWSGAFGGKTVDGCGSRSIAFADLAVSAADAQKQGAGKWPLSLTLVKGGKVIDRETTRASYGVVTVSGSDF